MRRKTTSLLQENYKILKRKGEIFVKFLYKILKESNNFIIRILVLSYHTIARFEEEIGNNRIRSV